MFGTMARYFRKLIFSGRKPANEGLKTITRRGFLFLNILPTEIDLSDARL